jgi:hypothetical protein
MAAFRLNEGISIYGSASFIKKTDSLKLIAFKKVRYDLSTYILDEPFIATCSIVVETSIWKEIADIPVLGGRYFASDKRLKLISLTKGDMIVGSNPSVVYRKGVVGSWSNRAIDKRVVVRELLDNLAITREVGLLSDYSDNELIYRLIEDEVLRKGSQLAGLKGIFSWILFVVFHFRSLSPRNIRAVLSVNPLINHLKNFKNKHTH